MQTNNITIVLGCMDLDYAIWVEQPPILTKDSTTEQKKDFMKNGSVQTT